MARNSLGGRAPRLSLFMGDFRMDNLMGNVNIKGWAMVPGLLLDDFVEKKVSGDALSLYALIRLQWGYHDTVFPKQSTIADLAGFSVSKIKRLLKELNDSGWILAERQARTHGNNQYFICDEPFVKPKVSKVSLRAKNRVGDDSED